jgi:hypothetical protein
MKTPLKVAIIATLTLLPVIAVVLYGVFKSSGTGASASSGAYQETDWNMLRKLNYDTGEKPADLAALDGKPIKVPGFVVPLDDDDTGLSEFLLVPSPQACVHVPPPPPNQMILVRMKGGNAPKRSWGPVWIMGSLHIASNETQFGKISYMLHGDSAEPYRMPEEELPPP